MQLGIAERHEFPLMTAPCRYLSQSFLSLMSILGSSAKLIFQEFPSTTDTLQSKVMQQSLVKIRHFLNFPPRVFYEEVLLMGIVGVDKV